MGIGGIARPMVVGDRLWLFSQTASGPAPVQTLLLNNGPILPPIPHTNMRGLQTPQMGPNGMMTRNPYGPNYPYPQGLNQSKQFSPLNPHQIITERDNLYMKQFEQPQSPNLRSPSSHFNLLKTDDPLSKLSNNNNYFRQPGQFDNAFLSKYSNPNNTFSQLPSQTTSGIADLERAFGNPNGLMLPHLSQHSPESNDSNQNGCNDQDNFIDVKDDSDDTSEIDCEEIDEKPS